MNRENFERFLYLALAVLLMFLSMLGLGQLGLGHGSLRYLAGFFLLAIWIVFLLGWQ
jgi:hypothetical protein